MMVRKAPFIMLSHELKQILSPVKMLVSRNALNPIYRAMEITPDQMRACTSWGILQVAVASPDIVERSVFVDRAAFLSVVQSLPKGHEFTLHEDGMSLIWTCGNARGRLALMPMIEMPHIDWPNTELLPFSASLATALELGSISCYTTALSAIGMHRIVVDHREGLAVSSTDNTSLSTGWISTAVDGIPDISTLPKDGAELLSTIIVEGAVLGSSDKAWYYIDGINSCKINLLPPMNVDIQAVRHKYSSGDIAIPIPHEAINRFAKRATTLAENKRDAMVTIATSEGKLVLGFKEGAVTTDEYFLLDGIPDIPEISLSSIKTARALSHVTELVLDHVERGVLLFRGPGFEYLLCGRLMTNEAKRR